MDFYLTTYNFLKEAGVEVSRIYWRERMESHPEYPAMSSLTDLLDEFGIENTALSLKDKARWRELDFPFLAFAQSESEEWGFEVVKSPGQIKNPEAFLKRWSGVAVTLGSSRSIVHDEHHAYHEKERRQKKRMVLLLSLFLLSLGSYQLLYFEEIRFTYFIFSLLGLSLSAVIVSRTMGFQTSVSDFFCRVQESGCNAVLNSKFGRFGGDIGLSDLAVVFFGGMLLYSTLSIRSGTPATVVVLQSAGLLVCMFTLTSLTYQWWLNSWCRLCLALTAIIWMQTAVLMVQSSSWAFWIEQIHRTGAKDYILLMSCFSLAAFWILTKPWLIEKINALHQRIRIRKWRQDPAWFDALLPLHKSIDDARWNREISYGNSNGVLQIIVVSDPYCEYCAKAHRELDLILAQHPEEIGVRVRFTLKEEDPGNDKYKAVHRILSAYEEFVWRSENPDAHVLMRSLIADWFELQDLEQWSSKYPLSDYKIDYIPVLIRQSVQWSRAMEVSQTPAFFINGFEMPNPHTFKDLFLFVSDYIQILRQRQKSSEMSLRP